MIALLIAAEPNSWFARHGISAEWAAVLGAVLSLVGAAIVAVIAIYLGDWLPSGKKKREELSKTLNEFAHVLLGMANDLEHGQRPTKYGQRLSMLLLRLDDKSRRSIRKVALDQPVALEELQEMIQDMHHDPKENARMKNHWIHDAKAVAGELHAIAANPR